MRRLIDEDRIPDDVTIQVLTQAREALIVARSSRCRCAARDRAPVQRHRAGDAPRGARAGRRRGRGTGRDACRLFNTLSARQPATKWTFEYSPRRVEKLVVLSWGPAGAMAATTCASAARRRRAPTLLAAGARGLTVNVHDAAAAEAPSPAPAPAGEPTPRRPGVGVGRQLRPARPDRRGVAGLPGCRPPATWSLESLFDDYGTTPHARPRTWPDGERSPGVLTVALIHRPEGSTRRVDRALARHAVARVRRAPAAHPLRAQRGGAVDHARRPEVHGIVEEGWPSAEHVADPMLFFNADGDPKRCHEQHRTR